MNKILAVNKLSDALNRYIALFDLDAFFVSVERLQDKRLIGKPVIVCGMSGRSVVSTCSYEARKFGVHSAMPLLMAKHLCPNGIYVNGHMELYRKYSKMVTDIIAAKAPVYEKASIDEHYLDLSGMERFFDCYKWTQELRQFIIKNTGLPISCALSVNKTIAKIAADEVKPNGSIFVPRQEVQSFLDPLSIKKIPMLGEKTFQVLSSMGISTIQMLRETSPEMMKRLFGKNGEVLWEKANGRDDTPVIQHRERKSLSNERTFEKDTSDREMLERVLVTMVEHLAYDLRKEQSLTSCVAIKIRYSDFTTRTAEKHIPFTSFDHLLIKAIKELFVTLYPGNLPVRLIGVRFSSMVKGSWQMDLFDDTPQMARLNSAMDTIRNRFGTDAVKRAVDINIPKKD